MKYKIILIAVFFCIPGLFLHAATTDYLHTDGTRILDARGNEVWLTGINWFGFETSQLVFHGLWNRDLESVLDQVVQLGFNVLRVPLHLAQMLSWRNNGGGGPLAIMIQGDINPYLAGLTTLEILDYTVNYCNSIGLKIIFDVHSLKPDGYHYNLWYDSNYSLNDLIEGWRFIAGRYNSNDVVIGADLKNEPHGAAGEKNDSAKWDNSSDPNNWKNAAEQIAAAVLGVNPNLLIFVEGVQYYQDSSIQNIYYKLGIEFPSWQDNTVHNYWWGGNLMGVVDYPLSLGNGRNKLVYSPHDYGPSVWTQPWFQPEVFNADNMHKVWSHYWLFIREKGIAPLFIGEWGGKLDNPENAKWMGYLRDLIRDQQIHHTFWCLNENSSDTGGILTGGTWDGVDTEKYNFIKSTLWQDASGRFIGLDYDVPLGPNGISLSDYYSGSPPPPTPTPTQVVTTPTPTPTGSLPGDVNSDGNINIIDALMTAQHYVGLAPAGFNAPKADVDCNGKINIIDALMIAQYYVGLLAGFC